MTVKELIKLLKKQPPDLQVVLSKDSEGNSYSPINGYGIGFYLSPSLEEVHRGGHGTFTDYPVDKAQKAIALYPAL